MNASQIRADARYSLSGKWGKAALITLVYLIINAVIVFVCNLIPVVGSIAQLVVSFPLSYGLIVTFIKLKRGEDVGYVDFLSNGFSSFGRVWGVIWATFCKMVLPVVLFIILLLVTLFSTIFSAAGSIANNGVAVASIGGSFLSVLCVIALVAVSIWVFVKGLLYSLSYQILYDNPNMTGKEIVNESARLMTGNRWNFVVLNLSFIGWAILASITLGIGSLWLSPYITVATICFYEELSGITPQYTVSDSSENTEEQEDTSTPNEN